ncbi:MAG: hypothetical protein U1B30_15690 [Pseudomonadota bacterium]|nr:hypothetical protein [Pseudomonadota bacterium]
MDVNGLYLIIGQQQAALVELRMVLQQLQEENAALKAEVAKNGAKESEKLIGAESS